jgi:DNA-binding PadR family transcriptional regulator
VTAPEIPDTLLLAALDRAARHSREGTYAGTWAVRKDLGISASSGEWRQIRRQLRTLESAGIVEAGRRNGVPIWSVTDAGREQLRSVDVELPESPQHRRWRDAHATAGRLAGRFRRELGNALGDAQALVRSEVAATSDTWFELGERLQDACQRVGSVTYGLREWAEPDDRERDEPDLSRARFVIDRAGDGGDA